MQRILVVLDGAIDARKIRQACTVDVAEPHELAICHVLPLHADSLSEGLRAQKEFTAALRQALGERAENVAVFVATDRDGYRVEDCARAWGATSVRP